ncbi:MAG: HAMP domain-containing protein [Gemmatimonadaceae bacterium]|nr:HAMP domain-containing protein [Gemmatimonadaceae bacterium]
MAFARLRWRSIEWKLPLLISALLAAVVVAFAVVLYGQLQALVARNARERLQSVSQQFATLLTASMRPTLAAASQLASDSALRAYLATPTPAARRAAEQHFAALLASGKSPPRGLELRDGAKRVVLRAGEIPEVLATAPEVLTPPMPPVGGAWIGGLHPVRDSVFASITTVLTRAPADTLGYVVQYVHLSLQGGAAIRDLIGNDAGFLLGNRDGSFWTDFTRVVPGPRIDRGRPTPIADAVHDGAPWLGAYADLSSMPWTVWVGFPERTVLAPVHTVLRHMFVLAVAVILVGAAVGWGASRRITRPLGEVVDAAEGIAAGDYSRRAPSTRTDELGRLATSFNTMAAQVEEGRRDLEQRVADRTRELSEALERLHAAQEELVRREKLALLGQLAGGVGHELRNPLGVMTNAVHYLGMVLTDAPPTVAEYLGILRTQIGMAERIVGDLLDSARVKAPQREPVSVSQLVQRQLERVDTPDGIAVQLDLPPDLPHVCVDSMQIGQVLLNLLTNGVQAMTPQGGRLTIRARADGARVRIDVIDTGPGISAETLPKIFEPLFTTKARGIGLGLSVARTLATANDGTLTVASRAGEGATFTLTLPTLERGAA